jgi:hypothetical protein
MTAFLTFLIAFAILLFKTNCEFSTEMPSDMKGNYLLIENVFGLSSRLRLLAGYMFEAEDFYNVPYVVMVWPLNKDCNAHFLVSMFVQYLANKVTFLTCHFACTGFIPAYQKRFLYIERSNSIL